MRLSTFASGLLSTSTLALLLSLGSAEAFEIEKFGTTLKANLAEQNIEVEWSSIEGDQKEVRILGAKFNPTDSKAEAFNEPIVLTDIVEMDKYYLVTNTSLPDRTYSEGETVTTVEDIDIEGIQLPYDAKDKDGWGFLLYDNASIAKVTSVQAGKEVGSAEGLAVAMEVPDAKDDAFGFGLVIEKFNFDLGDDENTAPFRELGLTSISGSYQISAGWQPSDGTLLISDDQLSLTDLGTFSLDFELGGFTREMMQQLKQKTEGATSASEDQLMAQGMSALTLTDKLYFNSMEIGFTDDGLTRRLLETNAKKQGTTPEALINQIKAIVPFVLASLNEPEFTTAAAQAINSFLDNPKNLLISAEPDEPVPFMEIIELSTIAPQTLIGKLGVSIFANQE